MNDTQLINSSELPCCPEISEEACCDRLQFKYRLQNRISDLPVEIVIVAELERCPGPLSLGDVVYSTTLLPGEKVRLYTAICDFQAPVAEALKARANSSLKEAFRTGPMPFSAVLMSRPRESSPPKAVMTLCGRSTNRPNRHMNARSRARALPTRSPWARSKPAPTPRANRNPPSKPLHGL